MIAYILVQQKVPDHFMFRREFDQYINLRPVKLFNGKLFLAKKILVI